MDAICSSRSSSSFLGWMIRVTWQLLLVANFLNAPMIWSCTANLDRATHYDAFRGLETRDVCRIDTGQNLNALTCLLRGFLGPSWTAGYLWWRGWYHTCRQRVAWCPKPSCQQEQMSAFKKKQKKQPTILTLTRWWELCVFVSFNTLWTFCNN